MIIYSIFSRGNVRQLWKLWGARLKLVKIKTFPLACRFIEFRTKSRFNYSIYWLKIWYWSKRWLKLKFALHQLQVMIRATLQSYSWIQHCDLGRSEQPSDLQLRSGFQWDLGFNHLLLQYHIFSRGDVRQFRKLSGERFKLAKTPNSIPRLPFYLVQNEQPF